MYKAKTKTKYAPIVVRITDGDSTWTEVVHVADRSGTVCALCCETIYAPRAPSFPEGSNVVVLGGDPHAAWRTLRDPNCRRQTATCGWARGI